MKRPRTPVVCGPCGRRLGFVSRHDEHAGSARDGTVWFRWTQRQLHPKGTGGELGFISRDNLTALPDPTDESTRVPPVRVDTLTCRCRTLLEWDPRDERLSAELARMDQGNPRGIHLEAHNAG